MNRPDAVVDFFIIEANEYIDRLDLLLAPAGSSGPEAQALARQARALRGSATMYRQPSISRVAHGIERVALGLRNGTLRWDAALRGTLVAAVDDLRLLVRAVRSWGATEEQRAAARAEELDRLAPHDTTPASSGASDSAATFLAAAAARLADAMDQLIASPDDRARLNAALEQVRGVRGLAALRDAAPLPEVCDAVERAIDVLDAGEGTTRPRQLSLLGSAAAVLRRAAADLAGGRRPSQSSPEVQRFAATVSALSDDGGSTVPVIPIADLFFAGEAGLIQASANPPSTPAARLRLELVSHAEHLRRLVAEARSATDPIAIGRVRRDLRSALRAIAGSAISFGEQRLARAVGRHEEGVTALDGPTFTRLTELAQTLSTPGDDLSALAVRIERSVTAATTPAAVAPATRAATAPNPGRQEPPARPRAPTPTGKDLYALLEDGIERLGKLKDRPLTPAVPLATEEVVPIESLLYSGASALQRARELRDEVRAGGNVPWPDLVDELVDLVALAAAD